MKKLLIATENFLPRHDGIARFLNEVIPRLLHKYALTMLAPDFGELPEPVGYRLIRFPTYKKLRFGDFYFAKPDTKVINQQVRQADICFVQTIGPIGAKTIRAAKKYGKPVVLYTHSIDYELASKAMKGFLKKYAGLLVKKRTRKLYNKSDLILVPAESVEETLQWQNITTPMEVVPLGIDPNKFCPAENKMQAKKAVGIEPHRSVIGYHGRLAREKDLLTLFRAFIRLQTKNPELVLLLLGDGLEEIKAMFRKRKGVMLVPSQENVVPFLQAMDVYTLTSLTETTSLSTLEAMSCELGVVATKVGFVKDYVVDGVNGFLIDKKQPYQLAKRIADLLGDTWLRKRLGKEARKTVQKRFNWDETVKNIEAALDRL